MPSQDPRDAQSLAEIIRGRRSVRAFQRRSVDAELVEQVLEAARWAPSPHGRQPWRFALLTTEAARQRLAAAMGDEWRRQLSLDGQDREIVELRLQKSRQRISEAPVVIVPCLYLEDLDHYPDAERQTAETTMAVQSLGCAVQNMLLTAYGLGLDAGWMCAPLFCPDTVRGALGLAETLIPHALIPLGYAARDPLRRERLPLEALVIRCD